MSKRKENDNVIESSSCGTQEATVKADVVSTIKLTMRPFLRSNWRYQRKKEILV
jgi:hypothetical protein